MLTIIEVANNHLIKEHFEAPRPWCNQCTLAMAVISLTNEMKIAIEALTDISKGLHLVESRPCALDAISRLSTVESMFNADEYNSACIAARARAAEFNAPRLGWCACTEPTRRRPEAGICSTCDKVIPLDK